ncbi:hypothetical protein ACFY0A_42340 [Streptomyces sp. NPDC001698]|uniref:hypothetical protein n=1 Tax=unclassified Streptomyces TaxID=2593676 RepID=UPI0036898211
MTWSYWVGAGGSLPIILFGPVACGRISRIDAAGKETNDHRHAGTQLGLGSAMMPRSRLTSPDVPHRPLMDGGREVQISFEAVWSGESALEADLARLAGDLAAAR